MSRPPELLRFPLGPFQANAYVLVGPSGRRAVVIDPGLDADALVRVVEERGLEVDWILDTHGHLDHVAGNARLRRATGAPLAIHPEDLAWLARLQVQGAAFGIPVDDSPQPDVLLSDGQVLPFDGLNIEVLHVPGHSRGSVAFRVGEAVIVGDTLFRGSVGRTDLPGGSHEDLVASIRERLFALPGGTVCWPGHGPETTVDDERRANPFVSDAACSGEAR
jgi:hydroxyacylglutathione hydrolase